MRRAVSRRCHFSAICTSPGEPRVADDVATSAFSSVELKLSTLYRNYLQLTECDSALKNESRNFETAFGSLHRGHQLNALYADRVSGEFVPLFIDMNQRTTAADRTPAECTTPFAMATGAEQQAVAGLRTCLFNFAISDIMRKAVDQCSENIVLASRRGDIRCPGADRCDQPSATYREF
ncbi:hypothetical protein RB195_023499 [Necator americanus]|uniref:Uncharacterized protein n=1 Tax=Necator americanus TaxID=51031 RepID=A0ABR1EJG0_NECAM